MHYYYCNLIILNFNRQQFDLKGAKARSNDIFIMIFITFIINFYSQNHLYYFDTYCSNSSLIIDSRHLAKQLNFIENYHYSSLFIVIIIAIKFRFIVAVQISYFNSFNFIITFTFYLIAKHRWSNFNSFYFNSECLLFRHF